MPRPSDPHARTRLLQAAQEVFTEKGLDRAKVEDITTRAGLSKGAFYLHFASKEEAFLEVVQAVLDHLTKVVDEMRAARSEVQRRGFQAFVDYWCDKDVEIFDYIWANRDLVRLTLEGGRSAGYQHLIEHFAMRTQENIEELLRIGIAGGIYRPDLNLKIAAGFMAGGYDRIARQLVRQATRPDLRTHIRELQRMVIQGAGTVEFIDTLQKLHEASKTPTSNDVESLNVASG
jgi:AcrR family transcriptional regulator